LAYSSSQEYRRQVILTSHHEDMTNPLIDNLSPPAGSSLKVTQFEEWTSAKGPSFVKYNSKASNEAKRLEANSIGSWLQAQLHARGI
jgi:hypothetical protein